MNKEYIKYLGELLCYPEAPLAELLAGADKINGACPELMNEALWAFEHSNYSFDGMKYRFIHMQEVSGLHEYTVAMLFLMAACESLEKRYAESGISQEIFVATMSDLRFKLIECINVKGTVGTFVASWYPGFFNMTRFACGRFQYEKREFKQVFGAGGHFLKPGDTVLNFHIPSSGVSLSDEVRYDSYRWAREFFFPGEEGPAAFVCSSWLLWPDYEEYIPDGLNLKKFRHDFTVISSSESEGFPNGWRVFGADAELPAHELPEKTSQQRLFKKYCMDGKRHGGGYGVFFFDGKKIVR